MEKEKKQKDKMDMQAMMDVYIEAWNSGRPPQGAGEHGGKLEH
jgi:hypothetical protein